jgi:hypothetical protein
MKLAAILSSLSAGARNQGCPENLKGTLSASNPLKMPAEGHGASVAIAEALRAQLTHSTNKSFVRDNLRTRGMNSSALIAVHFVARLISGYVVVEFVVES